MTLDKKTKRTIIAVVSISLLMIGCFVLGIVVARNTSEQKKNSSDVVADVEEFVEGSIIGSEGTVEVVEAKANLEDIIKISQLRTFRYNYNSICDVTENREIVYHVAYEGVVELGIDMSQMAPPTIDSENKSITVLLPEVEIQNISVNPGTMSYIWVDDSYDTPNNGTKAQRYCLDDLSSKIEEETIMFEMAKRNTVNEVEALFRPIIEQFYSDYSLVVQYESIEGEL